MKAKFLTFSFLVLTIGGLGLNGCQRADEQGVQAAREPAMIVAPAEQDFLMKVALEDRSEIEMARMAGQKSDNPEIRDYAQMLADEHAKNFEKVSVLLQEANMNPPIAPDRDMTEYLDKLGSLKGSDFDRQYINTVVENQEFAVAFFRQIGSTARNNKVRVYANQTLPKLQERLQKAQELLRSMH